MDSPDAGADGPNRDGTGSTADDGQRGNDAASGDGRSATTGSSVPTGSSATTGAGGSPPTDSAPDGPAPERVDDGAGPDPRDGVVPALHWAWTTEHGTVSFVRELLVSVAAVAFVGLLLFAISGVWPPMVAVESGSMEPQLYRGDLVFLTDQHRFVDDAAYGDTGVVTYRDGAATGYVSFGDYGDVVVFSANGRTGTPIIHRVRFWVDEGENWYRQANDAYLPEGVRSCAALSYCPAPHDGFVTKGDANRYYDQANRISSPVRPSWIRGTAELRIPWLGHVRLSLSELLAVDGVQPARTAVEWRAPVTATGA